MMNLVFGEIYIGTKDGVPNTVNLSTLGNTFIIETPNGENLIAIGNGMCVYSNEKSISKEDAEKIKKEFDMKKLNRTCLLINAFGNI